MNRILVLYRSKYGYTRTYAQMIAEALGCELREAAHLSPRLLEGYDTILYGGGVYAGRIRGLPAFLRHVKHPQKKNLIVWATGMCPGRPEEVQKIQERNLPGELGEHIRLFYLRGGFDYQKLSPLHRLMMNALRRKLTSSPTNSEEEIQLLKAYDTPLHDCSRSNLEPLIGYVRSL